MLETGLRKAYLNLLKQSLLGLTVAPTTLYVPVGNRPRRLPIPDALRRRSESVLATPVRFDLSSDSEGRLSVWLLPPWALTMIGRKRLDNLEACVQDVIESQIPGDFIETGVWRGGATILMRGVLRAFGVTDRQVYVADSFAGLPKPDADKYPADEGLRLDLWPGLAVSLEEVKANFARYDLLDDQVCFVEGWFRDTLPSLRDHTWAVIRLDGDLYESTTDALQNLYRGLSIGGWIIIDDYGEIPACRQAVADFRERNQIREPIRTIDFTGVCWQKESE